MLKLTNFCYFDEKFCEATGLDPKLIAKARKTLKVNGHGVLAGKIDLPTPILVEIKKGCCDPKTSDCISAKIIGTIGYIEQIRVTGSQSNKKDETLGIQTVRLKVEGERAISFEWYPYFAQAVMRKRKVPTKLVRRAEPPKPDPIDAVDMLGQDLKVGDCIHFQATHPVRGGCKYFPAFGQINKISDKGMVFANLLWIPEDWAKDYPTNTEKRVQASRTVLLNNIEDKLLELKWKA